MKILTLTPTLDKPVEGTVLSKISPNDKPWEVHRLQASEVAMLYAMSEYPQYSERIRQCALRLVFALVPLEGDEGGLGLKLRATRFCRVRHCPVCQWRRSSMWRARFFQHLPKILQDHPSHKFVFLTLTVKNCKLDELRATISHMNRAWTRLSQRKVWPGVGWVKSVEVTQRPGMMCHPHFHALLMVKPSYFSGNNYIKHEDWVDLWQKSLRIDYKPIVNIKTVKSKLKSDNLPEAVMQGITETIKYTVKPQDLTSETQANISPVDWLNGITAQLRNTRAIAIGGVFKDYLSEEEPEDLIHTEDEDISSTDDVDQVCFGWRERYGHYKLIQDE